MQTLQGYIKSAQQYLADGDNADALAMLQNYYGAQTSVRGYASDALSVINNQGLFGVTANQDVIQAIGTTAYTNFSESIVTIFMLL